jgi:hypothetical protein
MNKGLEKCNKEQQPKDCLECEKKIYIHADTTCTEVECKYGKFKFDVDINTISSSYESTEI